MSLAFLSTGHSGVPAVSDGPVTWRVKGTADWMQHEWRRKWRRGFKRWRTIPVWGRVPILWFWLEQWQGGGRGSRWERAALTGWVWWHLATNRRVSGTQSRWGHLREGEVKREEGVWLTPSWRLAGDGWRCWCGYSSRGDCSWEGWRRSINACLKHRESKSGDSPDNRYWTRANPEQRSRYEIKRIVRGSFPTLSPKTWFIYTFVCMLFSRTRQWSFNVPSPVHSLQSCANPSGAAP